MPDDTTQARKKAMDLLARREHTRAELARKLSAGGFDADVAAEAIDRLADEGLQSDERYVESFVQSRFNQGKGPVRIRAELGERGVAGSVIDDALEASGLDWNELARDVLIRKFGRNEAGNFTEKARRMRFLQYRGFEPEQIQAAVADAFD
jgi:regulatory protein